MLTVIPVPNKTYNSKIVVKENLAESMSTAHQFPFGTEKDSNSQTLSGKRSDNPETSTELIGYENSSNSPKPPRFFDCGRGCQ